MYSTIFTPLLKTMSLGDNAKVVKIILFFYQQVLMLFTAFCLCVAILANWAHGAHIRELLNQLNGK